MSPGRQDGFWPRDGQLQAARCGVWPLLKAGAGSRVANELVSASRIATTCLSRDFFQPPSEHLQAVRCRCRPPLHLADSWAGLCTLPPVPPFLPPSPLPDCVHPVHTCRFVLCSRPPVPPFLPLPRLPTCTKDVHPVHTQCPIPTGYTQNPIFTPCALYPMRRVRRQHTWQLCRPSRRRCLLGMCLRPTPWLHAGRRDRSRSCELG